LNIFSTISIDFISEKRRGYSPMQTFTKNREEKKHRSEKERFDLSLGLRQKKNR
jgi:hypothetical protein